jgi:hypothetical protein
MEKKSHKHIQTIYWRNSLESSHLLDRGRNEKTILKLKGYSTRKTLKLFGTMCHDISLFNGHLTFWSITKFGN